jgi:hypothetical protein
MIFSEAESGMPLYHVNCPNCHRPTFLGANGECRNVVERGAICGCALPLRYCDGDRIYSANSGMHESASAAGTYSWTWVPDDCARFQEFAMKFGAVQLDSASSYFFLWTARGGDPLASLFYADSGSVAAATGLFMPLDSYRQIYHPFFNDYEPHFQWAADGPGLIVHAPDGTHPDFRVYRDEAKPGKLVFLYNPAVRPVPRTE